jgi:hypothetical protein
MLRIVIQFPLRNTPERQFTGIQERAATDFAKKNMAMGAAGFWSFWFNEGRGWEGFEDWAEGDPMNALCVRDASTAPSK